MIYMIAASVKMFEKLHEIPPPEPSDESLMRLVVNGDAAALSIIYDRHHRIAMGLAFRILGSREAAEEVVQETFLAIWRQAASYHEERGRLRDWLLQITRNRGIDRLRRQATAGPMAELDPAMADHRLPEVWEQADRQERQEQVRAALATLPPEQQQAIELAYFGGLSQQEIAEQTGAPLGTVKGRMRLALGKLRQVLWSLSPDAEAQL
jgi:RNA polymerase sigma-70 factor (ECF subfamily)